MKKLIIAPSFLSKSINQYYFGLDPFYDVKVISKEDLYFSLYGNFYNEAIIYLLLNYNFSYSKASLYLSLLPYIKKDSDNSKLHELYLLKEDLIKHDYFYKNDAEALMFKNKEVLIYGYSENDQELTLLINSLSLKPTFIPFSHSENIKLPLVEYSNIEDESFAIMNSIASLIEKGVSTNDIYIYSLDCAYNYYFSLFDKSFNFKIDINDENSYYFSGISSIFLKYYEKCKDVNKALNEIEIEINDNELFSLFKDEILLNYYPELPYEKQLDLYINKFKIDSLPNKKYSNAIQVIKQPTFAKDKHIFVIGFNSTNFPHVFKDSDYLTDLEKIEIGLNDSLTASKCEHDLLVNFLKSKNDIYLSYCKRSASNNFYPSPFVVEFNLQIVPRKFPLEIFSQNYADFYFTKALDNERLYKEKSQLLISLAKLCEINYLSYDNSYITSLPYNNSEMKLFFTSIDQFFNCPFSFYLNYIVGLDPFEGNFNTKLGNIVHNIFQQYFNKGKAFNFDQSFNLAKEKEQPFSAKEELLLVGLKDSIKRALDSIVLHLEHIKNYDVKTEFSLTYTVDEKTFLVGRIDKAIIVDGSYVVIVDYKTGSKAFDDAKIDQGLSLQLPIYCYLASKDEIYQNYQLGGIYIHNVISNKTLIEQKEDELIPNYLRLNGKTLSSEDFISKFDDTCAEGKSSFINSLKRNKDGTLSGDSLVGKEIFDKYVDSAEAKIKEANQKIRENKFDIKPVYYKNDLPCKYCSYRDICFLKQAQIDYQSPEEEISEEDE